MKLSLIKDYTPKALHPLLREINYRFSKSEKNQSLQIKTEIHDVRFQWQEILKNTDFEKRIVPEQKLKIIAVTGYGLGTHFLTIEPIILSALYMAGHDILSLSCNHVLPSCEFNSTGNETLPYGFLAKGVSQEAKRATCAKCVSHLNENYTQFPFKSLKLSDHYTDEVLLNAIKIAKDVNFENFKTFKYKNVDVGEEVFASILRVTFKGDVENNSESSELIKRYTISGIIYVDLLRKFFEQEKPDRVMNIHGLYMIHGLPIKVAQSLGIPPIVIGGGGIRKDTVVMCHNETYHRQLVDEPNSFWENLVLTEDQRKLVLKYALQKRNDGNAADYANYHPNPINDAGYIWNYLNIPKGSKIVSLYTNVIWDAQIFYNGNVFNNLIDWLKFSIEEFSKNSKVYLVIRIHPAEAKGANPTKQPMLEEIKKMFPELPANIKIIPPESDISSYILAEMSQASIIYGTKMGLELALMKSPLIICGETFSRNKKYGIDIDSLEQYKAIICEFPTINLDINECYERALKYAYYFYFQRMLDLPFESLKKEATKKIKLSSLNDLYKDKKVQFIVKSIQNLSPFNYKEEL